MKNLDVIRELFDEKLIKVITIFLEEPERNFSLSQVSTSAKVNIATTSRILDKLRKKSILDVGLIGKTKYYKLKKSEKTIVLNKFLKSEEHLSDFLDKITEHPRVKKVILESKTNREAKILIVGNMIPVDKINSLVREIREKYSFVINFIEISEKQFKDMEKLGFYNLNKKVVWSRKENNTPVPD